MELNDELAVESAARTQSRFTANLATLYEIRKGRGRKRHLAIALGLTGAAVAVAAVLDHFNAPLDFSRYLALRVAVLALCAAGAAMVLRVRSWWWEAVAYGVPLVGQAILSAWVVTASPPDVIDRTIVIYLILFAVLCAVPPLMPAVAGALAAIWFCVFLALFGMAKGLGFLEVHLPALVVGAASLAIGTVLSALREKARRDEFRLSLRSETMAAELHRANAELERLMNTDVLTGVANRRRFEHEIATVWQSRTGRDGASLPIGLILIDVDHFKLFNDAAGHAEGDVCLRAIAGAISSVVRGGAFGVARWGGEEFVVLAPGIARRDIEGLAERVRGAVETLAIPHPARPGRIVTVSVGAAWCGQEQPCDSHGDLLRDADKALYEAKSAGRNRVAVAAAAQPDWRVEGKEGLLF